MRNGYGRMNISGILRTAGLHPLLISRKNLRNILEYAQSNSNVSGFLTWLDEDFTSLAYQKPVYRFFPHMENYHVHKSQMIQMQTLQHALMQFSKPSRPSVAMGLWK